MLSWLSSAFDLSEKAKEGSELSSGKVFLPSFRRPPFHCVSCGLSSVFMLRQERGGREERREGRREGGREGGREGMHTCVFSSSSCEDTTLTELWPHPYGFI